VPFNIVPATQVPTVAAVVASPVNGRVHIAAAQRSPSPIPATQFPQIPSSSSSSASPTWTSRPMTAASAALAALQAGDMSLVDNFLSTGHESDSKRIDPPSTTNTDTDLVVPSSPSLSFAPTSSLIITTVTTTTSSSLRSVDQHPSSPGLVSMMSSSDSSINDHVIDEHKPTHGRFDMDDAGDTNLTIPASQFSATPAAAITSTSIDSNNNNNQVKSSSGEKKKISHPFFSSGAQPATAFLASARRGRSSSVANAASATRHEQFWLDLVPVNASSPSSYQWQWWWTSQPLDSDVDPGVATAMSNNNSSSSTDVQQQHRPPVWHPSLISIATEAHFNTAMAPREGKTFTGTDLRISATRSACFPPSTFGSSTTPSSSSSSTTPTAGSSTAASSSEITMLTANTPLSQSSQSQSQSTTAPPSSQRGRGGGQRGGRGRGRGRGRGGGAVGTGMMKKGVPHIPLPFAWPKALTIRGSDTKSHSLSPSVLKSMLQKNVRLSRAIPAVRMAIQLMLRSSFVDFARRLTVIIFEDAIMHPLAPYLMHVTAMAAKTGQQGGTAAWQPTLPHVLTCLSIVYDVAAITLKDYLPVCFLNNKVCHTYLQSCRG
jgi:hypothetical protein